MNKKVKKACGKLIKKAAMRIASAEVNSACPFITYQPKLPEKAKELRRF